jgi:hypothetical protein
MFLPMDNDDHVLRYKRCIFYNEMNEEVSGFGRFDRNLICYGCFFRFLLFFGLDHIYTTWWFLCLLLLLSLSLASCTLSRQFPLFFVSKDFLFQKIVYHTMQTCLNI